jgi:hypothetical protein
VMKSMGVIDGNDPHPDFFLPPSIISFIVLYPSVRKNKPPFCLFIVVVIGKCLFLFVISSKLGGRVLLVQARDFYMSLVKTKRTNESVVSFFTNE